MDVYETVKRLFKESFGNKFEPKPTDQLDQIGIDSLDLVEFMLKLETEFNIEFTTDEIADLKYVNDVLVLINQKIK